MAAALVPQEPSQPAIPAMDPQKTSQINHSPPLGGSAPLQEPVKEQIEAGHETQEDDEPQKRDIEDPVSPPAKVCDEEIRIESKVAPVALSPLETEGAGTMSVLGDLLVNEVDFSAFKVLKTPTTLFSELF